MAKETKPGNGKPDRKEILTDADNLASRQKLTRVEALVVMLIEDMRDLRLGLSGVDGAIRGAQDHANLAIKSHVKQHRQRETERQAEFAVLRGMNVGDG